MTYRTGEPSRRTLLVVAFLLPLLIALISLPGACRYLWEEDAVGFALALDRFVLTDYTPHPPGYLFYVLLARAVHGWFGDPNTTFLALGLAANVATGLIILWLATALGGRAVGLISALLWPFNTIVWFYGQVSTVYPFEGLCGAAVAAATYRMMQGRRRWAFVSAAVLGLAGGFRGFVVVMLLPLWAYGLLVSIDKWRDRLGALVVLALAYGAWFLPTVWLAGGYGAFSEASRRLFLYNLKRTSVLWTANPSTALFNLALYGHFGLMGLGLMGVVVLVAGLLWPSVRRGYFSRPWDRRLVWFFALWIGVPSLFFLLVHLPKAGYLLIFLPAWIVLIAWGAASSSRALFEGRVGPQWAFLAALLAAHILVAAVVHVKVTRGLAISPADRDMDRLASTLRKGPCADPSRCMLISYGLPWRNLAYYLPEIRMAALADEASTWYPGYGAEVALAQNRDVRYASGAIIWAAWPRPSQQAVPVPSDVDTILWFVDKGSALFGELQGEVPLGELLFSQQFGTGALYETSREALVLPVTVGSFRLVEEGQL